MRTGCGCRPHGRCVNRLGAVNAGINDSVRRLLGCCPHLEPKWQRERADRMDDDPDNPLPYMQTAALAQVVLDAYVAEDRVCLDRKSTRLNSSHQINSYAVFCLKKKKNLRPVGQAIASSNLS